MVSIGDGAVEVEFGVSDTDGWGKYVLVSIKLVPSNCHAYTMDLCLVWL